MNIQSTLAAYMGYYHQSIKQYFEVGKLPESKEDERVTNELEEKSKRIQPIYNVRGKLVKRFFLGRYINLIA